MMTYDSSPYQIDGQGNMRGKPLGGSYRTHDGRTCDSTGAFLVGELERLDMKMHEPLASVTWGRDVDLRQDVTIADDVTSFTLSTYGSPSGAGTGNVAGSGKAWVGRDTTQISGISLDIARIPHPLRPWALEVKFTIFELESAAKLGRPVDAQKLAGLQLKHQMDTDEQVYFGDSVLGDTGLVNCGLVTEVTNVAATGTGGSTRWQDKSPNDILADLNAAITLVWQNAGWAVMPNRILLPPTVYGYVSTVPVTLAGSVSILKYLKENNILTQSGLGPPDILPVKWCIGTGVGGSLGVSAGHDRMVVYRKEEDKVRYPMTLLQRTPVQYDGLYHKTTYFGRLGVIEAVYPETIGYFDGIS